ncbi:5'-nucleotidase C-terminal domain-containing protein [Haloflavibacter putidus]|uniref:5'-Nucleotidase C-terminal domain-containing protein n=1 Tax=Haloflavibacter putidus TaxID=2576776 RepID=A0A507ZSW8_9FLAO|nr:5'-nucleotidase C-terminal domain-containing protein [Haloflavibacter putidus]TQD39344.1 hypothetical protein FKR84_05470 [Haloflavibacter putidus]
MKRTLFVIFSVTLLLINSCKEEKEELEVSKIEGKQLRIEASIKENDSIKNFIEPYKNRIEEEMNTVLSYTPTTLSKEDGKYNTAIGNMMADAVLEMANPIFKKRTGNTIDGVLLNHGGIRSIISKGDITTKTGFNIMPFENEAVIIGLKGTQVQKMFVYLAKNQIAHPIAGMQLTLDKNGAIKSASIQGKKIEPDTTYYIATNDYLMEGGDRMYFFGKRESQTYLDYKLRNIFIDYFKKHDTINPVRDQRFIQE